MENKIEKALKWLKQAQSCQDRDAKDICIEAAVNQLLEIEYLE